ncbi:hypothetical protein [Streptomyces sp. NPDC048277]|uniref:hypothetical protein n=1 Tax=Streptomyces sp. NPDC048277 TaxID=3155027 RepID=UPI0033D2B2B5
MAAWQRPIVTAGSAANDVREGGGAAAVEPGHGVLAVRRDMQMRGAFAVVVVDPDRRRVPFQQGVDGTGRPASGGCLRGVAQPGHERSEVPVVLAVARSPAP